MKKLSVYLQYIVPQHTLSRLSGRLANSKRPWLKNYLIRYFLNKYDVSLDEADISDPTHYLSFNHFFTRALRKGQRPIASEPQAIASPVDGSIACIDTIRDGQLFQAKGHYFDLVALLGGERGVANYFYGGTFTTLYLAPHNYHRIHMPITGTLLKTIYVPGRLFSVNGITAQQVPQLYSRNERLICLFKTEAGPMAVILVGAMIVGSMKTVWMDAPIRSKNIQIDTFDQPITLQKGEELGHFELGSTVLVLFAKDKMAWQSALQVNQPVQMGQLLGYFYK